MLERSGECNQCGECCKAVNITVVRDITLKQHKNLRELKLYLSYRGIRVVGEDVEANQLFYSINISCQKLGAEGECKVHEDVDAKPIICNIYPTEPDGIKECGYEFKPSSLFEFEKTKTV